MGFLDPKQRNDEDEALPGASGLHLDLDLKRCPSCRREVDPWRDRCPDCGVATVAATEMPGADFPLPPGLADLAAADAAEQEAAGDGPSGDADDASREDADRHG